LQLNGGTLHFKHNIILVAQRALMTIAIILASQRPANAQESNEDDDGDVFFSTTIEPLLRLHCFGCHSHAGGELEGGLTLDSRSGWAEGGDRGPAVVPGNPKSSLIMKALQYTDEDLQMPPDGRLPAEDIKLFKHWIERGAPDPRNTKVTARHKGDPLDWWSLRPLAPSSRPGLVIDDSQHQGVIDMFVREQLQEAKLSAAPCADRRTLIRRVYFDLHGLPPTPEAVAAFVDDPDPTAYEQLVDRLLESPRYGERWARHWLDTVHFADSHGCEHDVLRPNAWRYRDYVISSFNQDTPWPRFIREQLAADRFFPEEPQLTAALGFIAAGPLELSRASTAPVTFDYLDRDDMVTQTMAAFASTTANCARCHDHKFDPVSQEDYYALQAVFAGTGKGDVTFDSDPVIAADRRRWNELLVAIKNGDRTRLFDQRYADIVAEWEQSLGSQSAVWEPLVPSTFVSSDGATLEHLEDDSILASGLRPEKDTYTITASSSLNTITALRLDVLVDDSLPKNGPGRQDNGNLHLTEFEMYVTDDDDNDERERISIRAASADWNQAGWTISHALDENDATAWGVYPKVDQSHYAVFELQEALTVNPADANDTSTHDNACDEQQHGNSRQIANAGSRQIVIVLKQLHGAGHLIGRVKLYVTSSADGTATILPELVRSGARLESSQRSQDQQVAIAGFALKLHAEKQLARLPAAQSVYGVSNRYSRSKKLDGPASPKVVHVLRRGNIHEPGVVAQPGALSAITALAGHFDLDDPNDEASRRAALADWLAAPENPLTWRSIVNRVWCFHFGRGLCDTPNDFGRMGGTPSHPELLDWLAIWFRDEANGSLKKLHRLILLSATYQQAASMDFSVTPASDGLDPHSIDADNRLLWRMNRRRLDAESYRDAVLQISGSLDLTIGGPGVQQFTQTKGAQLTPKLDYDAFDWNDPGAARRSIYRVVWRGIADPFMESLDFPDLGLLSPRRGVSVSALQALTVFNNDFVLHHSQVLSDNLKASQETLDGQVSLACRLIYLRDPSQKEKALLVSYAGQHGLAAMCRILLNSNEFVYVD
jgi:Protein of unknown function (DUF1549)/Protein of unknown function (DUF1553)/Planctomycete cytochrome C